jgi:hypothetical protein
MTVGTLGRSPQNAGWWRIAQFTVLTQDESTLENTAFFDNSAASPSQKPGFPAFQPTIGSEKCSAEIRYAAEKGVRKRGQVPIAKWWSEKGVRYQ